MFTLAQINDIRTRYRTFVESDQFETLFRRCIHRGARCSAADASPGGAKMTEFIRPVWPGSAINTVAYAAILWGIWLLVFAAPLALQRRRRIRRGVCPECSYPTGTSSLCTECGRPVTPRRVG